MTNIPIFLASDNNYAPFVATTIASICDNTKSFIDFYILDSGINEENKNKIKSIKNKFNNFEIEFIKIDVEKEFKNFNVSSYISMATYNRFLIPQLKPNLSKVIYLDVDIIVLGDIKELYDQNINSFAIGAIADQGNVEYIYKLKNNLDMSKNSTYFNAGVLLMDLNKWREDEIVANLFKIEEKYRDNLLCNDQDILNKYFENNYKLLDKKFNVMIKGDEIIVRHYVFEIKPWHIPTDYDFKSMNNLDDFKKYVKMLDLNLEQHVMPIHKVKFIELFNKKHKGKLKND